MPDIPSSTLAHYRRNASAPDAYVCSVAAGDLLALLDRYEAMTRMFRHLEAFNLAFPPPPAQGGEP